MAFRDLFEDAIVKFNDRAKTNPDYQEVLREYNGRTVSFQIEDDTTYVISISMEGSSLTVSPQNSKEDMVLQTSKSIMDKMINERKVDAMDLLMGRIKVKNITLKEVSVIKKLLKI
ncbi:MAG: SCP2 sterol-binding domain-containing protein [Candidatus Bathyarchaeia archaeon]